MINFMYKNGRKSPRVNSAMALYLKLHVMRSTIYVESFVVLHNIANFGGYAAILY